MSDPAEARQRYGERMAALAGPVLQTLEAFDTVRRQLHPPVLPALRNALGPLRERFDEAFEAYRETPVPPGLEGFHQLFSEGASRAGRGLELFLERGAPEEAIPRLLRSLRAHCGAQEVLYALRRALPQLGAYFVESDCPRTPGELDPDPADPAGVGLMAFHEDGSRASAEAPPPDRGGYWLYVPEWYQSSRSWPAVVALHGGSGHGREYLWTWLREARSRGALVIAPTASERTWSLDDPDRDTRRLAQVLDRVAGHWNVDRDRVLLTGLSDGATFTLLAGLSDAAPYSALAPVSGVLHPACYALGHLDRAQGKRIYLVHGALDWMFPLQVAHLTRDELRRCDARLTYREIEDLSHTYPREENAAILEWFDPALALAADG